MRYLNSQMYSECQLVTAINAAVYLGQPPVRLGSAEYERLVDLVGARHGSAIRINRAHRYLRLKYVDLKPEFYSIRFSLDRGMPVEIGVHSDHHGFHSALVVDVEVRGAECVRFKVPNLRRHTDRKMWMTAKELNRILRTESNIGPTYGYFRAFYVDEMYT